MEAPTVVVLMATGCAELYVPAGGLNVGVATGAPAAGGSKNRPLMVALVGPVFITRRITCPVSFHIKYFPFWKLLAFWLFSTASVVPSKMLTVIARAPPVSQSRQ